jgi:hypothetical protein
MSDQIETSYSVFAQPGLMHFIRKKHRELGRTVRILDPCYGNGNIIKVFKQINQDEGHKLVHLIHRPEMCLHGSMEVNRKNLGHFKRFKIDLIVTNPPWSSDALAVVLSVMMELAQLKEIPLLFIIPWRSTRTHKFREIFAGKTLFTMSVEPAKFHACAWTMDTYTLTWFAHQVHRRPSKRWGSEPIRAVSN